jgi:hypothetical protein
MKGECLSGVIMTAIGRELPVRSGSRDTGKPTFVLTKEAAPADPITDIRNLLKRQKVGLIR